MEASVLIDRFSVDGLDVFPVFGTEGASLTPMAYLTAKLDHKHFCHLFNPEEVTEVQARKDFMAELTNPEWVANAIREAYDDH